MTSVKCWGSPLDLKSFPIGVCFYSWLRTCWNTHKRWPRPPGRGWQSKESDCKRFSQSDSGNSLLNQASSRGESSQTFLRSHFQIVKYLIVALGAGMGSPCARMPSK